jgi:hypothetical protein
MKMPSFSHSLGVKKNIPRDVLSRAIAGSLNLGLYRDGAQAGFAWVISDKATFAWLSDVFSRIVLATTDAHQIYADCGFVPLPDPQRWMGHHNSRNGTLPTVR